MSSVARVTTITVRSETSFEDAVATGIARAAQTLRHVSGAWVKEQIFSADERFGLTAQLRRAAISVPSNIGEGARRRGGAFRLHVEIALGSQGEIEVQIELARRLGHV